MYHCNIKTASTLVKQLALWLMSRSWTFRHYLIKKTIGFLNLPFQAAFCVWSGSSQLGKLCSQVLRQGHLGSVPVTVALMFISFPEMLFASCQRSFDPQAPQLNFPSAGFCVQWMVGDGEGVLDYMVCHATSLEFCIHVHVPFDVLIYLLIFTHQTNCGFMAL